MPSPAISQVNSSRGLGLLTQHNQNPPDGESFIAGNLWCFGSVSDHNDAGASRESSKADGFFSSAAISVTLRLPDYQLPGQAKGDAGKGRVLTRSNWQSGEPRCLLAGVSPGGAETGAQIPTRFATRITGRDVVEMSMVHDGIGQLVVHRSKLRQGRLLSAAGRVHDAGKGRRRPTSTSHRTPASIEENGSATKVGSDIRIAAMVSYDADNAILIAGTRLVGTNVSAPAASVVLLVGEISVTVTVKEGPTNRRATFGWEAAG